MFDVKNVAVQLAGKPVIREASFLIRPGERIVVLGTNGSGKTTLLKLLDGLVFASSGRVEYQGEELTEKRLENPQFRRSFRGQVSLLFQNVDAMLFNPTVRDEIAFGPRQLDLNGIGERIEKWSKIFDIENYLERAPFELSGGEKKRVALAACLAIEPRVLLLDEPVASLDPANVDNLIGVLQDLSDVTVVASTHNLTIAEELGDRALLFSRGELLFDGPTRDLLANEQLLDRSGLVRRKSRNRLCSASA